MADVIDLEKRRAELREAIEKQQEEGMVECPNCGDTLFWVLCIPEYEEERAVICQHCTEPVAVAYEFGPDDEQE